MAYVGYQRAELPETFRGMDRGVGGPWKFHVPSCHILFLNLQVYNNILCVRL